MGVEFTIEHKVGAENKGPDALSRWTKEATTDLMTISVTTTSFLSEIKEALIEDSFAQDIIKSLPSSDVAGTCFSLQQDILYFKGKIYVPLGKDLRQRLLDLFHGSLVGGHSGEHKTYTRLAATFYWPKMRKDTQQHVKDCSICQHTKPENFHPKGLLQPLPIPSQVWEDISMDFITSLPSAGGKTVIWVIVDRLSKYGHFCALPEGLTAPKLAEYFIQVYVRHHGFPRSIVSDRDRLFISMFWKELFRLQGTTLKPSTAYHPQTDGQTEALNRCLEMYLRAFVSDCPTRWVHTLPWAE